MNIEKMYKLERNSFKCNNKLTPWGKRIEFGNKRLLLLSLDFGEYKEMIFQQYSFRIGNKEKICGE